MLDYNFHLSTLKTIASNDIFYSWINVI